MTHDLHLWCIFCCINLTDLKYFKLSFSQVSTKVTVSDILPSTKAAFSFKIPDHKSGKVSKMQLTEMKLVKILKEKDEE